MKSWTDHAQVRFVSVVKEPGPCFVAEDASASGDGHGSRWPHFSGMIAQNVVQVCDGGYGENVMKKGNEGNQGFRQPAG